MMGVDPDRLKLLRHRKRQGVKDEVFRADLIEHGFVVAWNEFHDSIRATPSGLLRGGSSGNYVE